MPRYPKYMRPMTLIDSLSAAITDPYGTMNHLLNEREKPPFLILTFLSILGIIVIPILIYQYKYELTLSDKKFTYAWMLALAVAWLFFVLLLTVFMRLVGVATPILKIIASTIYALTPIFPFAITYYLGNYKTIGRVTVIGYFLTGLRSENDWFLSLFPYFFWVTACFCFLAFSQALRAIGRMSFLGSIVNAGMALGLLALSLFIGVTVAEAAFPDSGRLIWRFFLTFPYPPEGH